MFKKARKKKPGCRAGTGRDVRGPLRLPFGENSMDKLSALNIVRVQGK